MIKKKYLYFIVTIIFFTLYNIFSNNLLNVYLINELNFNQLQNILSWQSLIKFGKLTELNHSSPFITILFSKFIYVTLGYKVYNLIYFILFPSLIILFIALIYNRYLSLKFSFLLAFISGIFFPDFPLRDFIFNIFSGQNLIIEHSSLEILTNPTPSFTILYFLIIFYFAQNIKSISLNKIIFFTILFASLFFVHPLDAIYGCGFWTIFCLTNTFRSKNFSIEKKILVSVFLIAFYVALAFFIYDLFKENNIFSSNEYLLPFNYYNFFSFIILPLFFSILTFYYFKVDIYEVIYRYWFIYVVLLIEFVILLFFSLQPLPGSDEYFLNYRINQFLFHFYYFVPALNVITRNTYFLPNFQSKALIKMLNISKNIIPHVPKIFIIFGIFLSFQLFLDIKNKYTNKEKLNVSDAKLINTMISENYIFTDNFKLLINTIGNKSIKPKSPYVPVFFSEFKYIDTIEFYLLFSYLNNWSSDEVIKFFSPGNIYNKSSKIDLNNKEDILSSGAGYYSVFNYQILNQKDLVEFHSIINEKYNNIDINKIIKKLKIEKMYLSKNNFEFLKQKSREIDIITYE